MVRCNVLAQYFFNLGFYLRDHLFLHGLTEVAEVLLVVRETNTTFANVLSCMILTYSIQVSEFLRLSTLVLKLICPVCVGQTSVALDSYHLKCKVTLLYKHEQTVKWSQHSSYTGE